jgi:hypothetical protein
MLRAAVRTGIALAVATAAAGGIGACGDSGDKTVAASSLKPRLIPVSLVAGFHVLRTFDWSDPVDLAGEGFFLPEATRPSAVVKTIRDAGFAGAAGEQLAKGAPPDEELLISGVIKLKSDGGAATLRDWLHRQDLKQPCYSQCIFSPREFAVSGVPGIKAVRQAPNIPPPKGAPPDAGPPTRYLAEFTVGRYLYFVWFDGGKGDGRKLQQGARAWYARVKGLASS